MSAEPGRALHETWAWLRAAGPSTAADLARATETLATSANRLLVALVDAGHARRRRRRDRAYVYRAIGRGPQLPMSAIRAVREVLAEGPVRGVAEVARLTDYSEHAAHQALRVVAENLAPHGAPGVYRLRGEGVK